MFYLLGLLGLLGLLAKYAFLSWTKQMQAQSKMDTPAGPQKMHHATVKKWIQHHTVQKMDDMR
jgi:uncharacterized membrane protein